jgi:hypothetical protein
MVWRYATFLFSNASPIPSLLHLLHLADVSTDARQQDVGRTMKDVFGKIIKPVVYQWKDWIPDDKARAEFADQAYNDFYNADHHFYNVMYLSFAD